MTILMLYGDHLVDFQQVVQFLTKHYNFKSTQLRTLTESDFRDGELTIQAEDDLDTSMSTMTSCLNDWSINQVIYPIYTHQQASFVKRRAYISVVRIHEPIMVSFEKSNSKDLKQFIQMTSDL